MRTLTTVTNWTLLSAKSKGATYHRVDNDTEFAAATHNAAGGSAVKGSNQKQSAVLRGKTKLLIRSRGKRLKAEGSIWRQKEELV